MEMTLNNGFCEMSQGESMEIEGGVADILIIGGLLLGVAAFEYAVAAITVCVAKDLENCYNNGYNSVMSSVSGGDAR